MSRAHQRGFTLVEAVVAFAILGLSLSALYGSFESALTRCRKDTHVAEATLIAQSLLARAGTEWPVEASTQTGKWEEYRYSLIQSLPDGVEEKPKGANQRTTDSMKAASPVLRVTATVSWDNEARSPPISIATLKPAAWVTTP